MVRYTVAARISLGACLVHLLPGASGRTRKQILGAGRVRVNGRVVRTAGTTLVVGDVVEIAPRTPPSALPPGLALVHEDAEVIVVDKPAGLLTIATDRERARTAYAHLTAHARARRPPGRVFVVSVIDILGFGILIPLVPYMGVRFGAPPQWITPIMGTIITTPRRARKQRARTSIPSAA